jgi:acetylornithine deacetylase/succinyl-diaminopimelate desuccinylase-like protein
MDSSIIEKEKTRFLTELKEWLAIPSISTLPDRAADTRRAATWVADHLKSLGCTATLLEGKGHPVVWGESPAVPGKPTLLIYGHYDVQPPDPLDQWDSPPFEPTVRDGKLFARGAADDKGQVYCLLKAYQAVLDAKGQPPINVRWLIEGEEECGGKAIFELLQNEPGRSQADAVLVCDMSYYAPGWPAVYTGLRGMCYAEISVRTLRTDLHSGTYGGVAPNAIETLIRILTALKDEDGRIRIKGIYKAVKEPSKAELKSWKKLPFDKKSFTEDEVTARALTGLKDHSVFERTWALPTFEIHGIKGGFVGDGAKTVIPAQATAKVSLRLVPEQSLAKVEKQLRREVLALAPDWAEVEVTLLHGGEPVHMDLDHPVFEVLDEAFESVVGQAPVRARAGGSIPVVTELAKGGAPVLLTGIGLHDDRLHAPNEKLDLQQLWDGIQVFGRFFELLGEREMGGKGMADEEEAEEREEEEEYAE